MTISLGVASLPDDDDSAEEVLVLADESLLLAKQRGRNQVVSAGELPSSEEA